MASLDFVFTCFSSIEPVVMRVDLAKDAFNVYACWFIVNSATYSVSLASGLSEILFEDANEVFNWGTGIWKPRILEGSLVVDANVVPKLFVCDKCQETKVINGSSFTTKYKS